MQFSSAVSMLSSCGGSNPIQATIFLRLLL